MGISRSENMRRIRSRNTAPELVVRAALRRLGHVGYRLHKSDLPGRPDVAFVGRKKAIFVHGCFWHGHDCAEGARLPKSNVGYWLPKIRRNRQRDEESMLALEAGGWSVLVLWECELGDADALQRRLDEFLRG
ncbi:MAG TPA: DNA mismatch endonuclease Vsr [Candidatus Hydrogenedentes bacterium]|nr:DNA mismatch endonuclease Vsr [Candidatus Hydrogenedentota bacterium]